MRGGKIKLEWDVPRTWHTEQNERSQQKWLGISTIAGDGYDINGKHHCTDWKYRSCQKWDMNCFRSGWWRDLLCGDFFLECKAVHWGRLAGWFSGWLESTEKAGSGPDWYGYRSDNTCEVPSLSKYFLLVVLSSWAVSPLLCSACDFSSCPCFVAGIVRLGGIAFTCQP